MRKEILFAVLLGTLVGLGATYFFWKSSNHTLPDDMVTENTSIPSQSISPSGLNASPTPEQNQSTSLRVLTPANMAVVSESTITLRGSTKPESTVLVSGTASDYLGFSDNNGIFSVDVKLAPGMNEFRLNAIKDKVLLGTTNTMVVNSNQVKSSDNLNAFLGTITDIAGKNIQINEFNYTNENSKGTIKQVVLNDNTTYGSTKDTKAISFGDLAIGDFIIAIGSAKNGNLINAERIIVSSAYQPLDPKSYFGKVTGTNKNILTLRAENASSDIDFLYAITDTKVFEVEKLKSAAGHFGDITPNSVVYVVEASGTESKKVLRQIVIFEIGLESTATPKAIATPKPAN